MLRDLDDQLAALGRHWNDVVPPVTASEVVERTGPIATAPPSLNGRARRAPDDELPIVLRLEPPAPRRRPRRRAGTIRALAGLSAAAALVGGMALVARRDDGSGVSFGQPGTSPPAGPGGTAAPAPAPAPAPVGSIPEGDAAIEPGRYRVPASAWAATDFTITFPSGWETQYGHLFRKHPETDDEFGFYATVVDDIYTDACGPDRSLMDVGPSAEDLADALAAQAGPDVTRRDTTVGSYPAIELTITVPADLDVASCRLGEFGLQVWYERPPIDNYFVVFPDGPSTVYIVDVDGQRQVFVTRVRTDTSSDDLAELDAILASIRFQP